MVEQGLLLHEEAENHPDANVITGAVGAQNQLFLDLNIYPVQHNDIFLLCSDGLYKDVTDSEIVNILSTPRTSCQKKAKTLIELALIHGGKDNITVVVIQAR